MYNVTNTPEVHKSIAIDLIYRNSTFSELHTYQIQSLFSRTTYNIELDINIEIDQPGWQS